MRWRGPPASGMPPPIVLRARYAMSGTDLRYAATSCQRGGEVPYAMSGFTVSSKVRRSEERHSDSACSRVQLRPLVGFAMQSTGTGPGCSVSSGCGVEDTLSEPGLDLGS
eukprot:3344303-Rhodomonas_salina.2